MHRIFGRKKADAAPVDLSETSGRLDKRVEALDAKIRGLDRELLEYKKKIARTKGPAQKSLQQRALQLLKRKRMFEQQREAISSQSFNLEQTNFALQSMKDTTETVKAMKSAADSMRTQFKTMNVDAVEDLQDDLAELMAESEEMQEVMSRSYGMPLDVDESELMGELAGLEDHWDAEGATEADALPDYLPTASAVPVEAKADGVAVDEYGLPVASRSTVPAT